MNIFPESTRRALALTPDIGAGNFLFAVDNVIGDNRHVPFIATDQAVMLPDGKQYKNFSIDLLIHGVKLLATWYLAQQIKTGDKVAIYIPSSFANILHYLALTSIGAVPVLINGNLDARLVAKFCNSVTPSLIVTTRESAVALEISWQSYRNSQCKVALLHDIDMHTAHLPSWYPFCHKADDTVMICHTSGTTGVPKPVILQHQKFFHAIHDFLLNPPDFLTRRTPTGQTKLLSILPTAHNSCISYFMRAITARMEFMLVTKQAFAALVEAIRLAQPSIVIAFPHYYVELANAYVEKPDLRSVSFWLSTGDAAHQVHIRKIIEYGQHYTCDSRRAEKLQQGSFFIDCLGSSEMGTSLFRFTHQRNNQVPLRYIGQPMSFVNALVFDDGDNEINEPYRIGKLAVCGQSITSGYFNDARLNELFIKGHYLLTGDMVYRDVKGNFYQVDRITDVINTPQGKVYSILTEEILLQNIPELYDCIVVGMNNEYGKLQAVAFLITRTHCHLDHKTDYLNYVNAILCLHQLPTLQQIRYLKTHEIPFGITGKVLKRVLRDNFVTH